MGNLGGGTCPCRQDYPHRYDGRIPHHQPGPHHWSLVEEERQDGEVRDRYQSRFRPPLHHRLYRAIGVLKTDSRDFLQVRGSFVFTLLPLQFLQLFHHLQLY